MLKLWLPPPVILPLYEGVKSGLFTHGYRWSIVRVQAIVPSLWVKHPSPSHFPIPAGYPVPKSEGESQMVNFDDRWLASLPRDIWSLIHPERGPAGRMALPRPRHLHNENGTGGAIRVTRWERGGTEGVRIMGWIGGRRGLNKEKDFMGLYTY